ncbi:hypothetical protein MRX96_019991 [Rhipicephalus microplus]
MLPSAAGQTPPPYSAGNAVGSAMSRRAAAGQAAASDVASPTRERAANRPGPGVSTAGGPHSADTPECPRWQEQWKVPTIMVSSPTTLSRRAVAVAVREEIQDSGGADLCERSEGPPFAAPPPLWPDPSRRLANLVASHSRDSSPLALLPLWPCRRPLLFLRPRLLQLPLSRPSLLLLSPEADLLCPRLLWPRLLRQ